MAVKVDDDVPNCNTVCSLAAILSLSLSLCELETGLAREIESVARVFGKRDETENTVQDIGHWTVSISIMIGLSVKIWAHIGPN